MGGGDVLEVTETVANNLIGKTGLVAITGVGIINLNSVMSVLPKGAVRGRDDSKSIKCHDGSIAVKKFGKWIDQYSGAEMDLTFYPELIDVANDEKLLGII